MAKVRISFSADLTEIGKVRSVSDDEAAVLVREGRATYVAEPPPDPADRSVPAPRAAKT